MCTPPRGIAIGEVPGGRGRDFGMMVDKLLHGGLAGIMCRGLDSVPNDPPALLGYLRAIFGMLRERAEEHEPCWGMTSAAAGEVETLLRLEGEIARRAAEMPAATVGAVLDKLAIWQCIAEAEVDDEPAWPGHALIRSVIDDLQRIDQRSPMAA